MATEIERNRIGKRVACKMDKISCDHNRRIKKTSDKIAGIKITISFSKIEIIIQQISNKMPTKIVTRGLNFTAIVILPEFLSPFISGIVVRQ